MTDFMRWLAQLKVVLDTSELTTPAQAIPYSLQTYAQVRVVPNHMVLFGHVYLQPVVDVVVAPGARDDASLSGATDILLCMLHPNDHLTYVREMEPYYAT